MAYTKESPVRKIVLVLCHVATAISWFGWVDSVSDSSGIWGAIIVPTAGFGVAVCASWVLFWLHPWKKINAAGGAIWGCCLVVAIFLSCGIVHFVHNWLDVDAFGVGTPQQWAMYGLFCALAIAPVVHVALDAQYRMDLLDSKIRNSPAEI